MAGLLIEFNYQMNYCKHSGVVFWEWFVIQVSLVLCACLCFLPHFPFATACCSTDCPDYRTLKKSLFFINWPVSVSVLQQHKRIKATFDSAQLQIPAVTLFITYRKDILRRDAVHRWSSASSQWRTRAQACGSWAEAGPQHGPVLIWQEGKSELLL